MAKIIVQILKMEAIISIFVSSWCHSCLSHCLFMSIELLFNSCRPLSLDFPTCILGSVQVHDRLVQSPFPLCICWVSSQEFTLQLAIIMQLDLVGCGSSHKENSWIEDKLSSTTVDFTRSEGELKNCALYGF